MKASASLDMRGMGRAGGAVPVALLQVTGLIAPESQPSVKPSDRVPFYVLRLFEEVLVYLLEDERLLDGHSAVMLDHERS